MHITPRSRQGLTPRDVSLTVADLFALLCWLCFCSRGGGDVFVCCAILCYVWLAEKGWDEADARDEEGDGNVSYAVRR